MIQDDYLFAQTRTYETLMVAFINADAATGYHDIQLRGEIAKCQIKLNLIHDFIDTKQGAHHD